MGSASATGKASAKGKAESKSRTSRKSTTANKAGGLGGGLASTKRRVKTAYVEDADDESVSLVDLKPLQLLAFH